MDNNVHLRLGTRSSLLAVAQSQLVKQQLEALHQGLTIELVCTDTRGDEDLLTPLTEVSDPDFFSAELDAALLNNRVDFCVHSYKDLPPGRPAGISRVAIPEREQPHDVVLFRSDIVEHLQKNPVLRLGTCSLRREVNVSDFLQQALPVQANIRIAVQALRGPVHDRIQRITAASGEPEFDGVVIALAGLNRLWTHPEGRTAIAATLKSARWMVLPLSQCPAAPGQGALALECRTGDTTTQPLLAALHDATTAELVALEHTLVDATAAGNPCGATAVSDPELGYVARVRGRKLTTPDEPISYTRTGRSTERPEAGKAWNDKAWRQNQTTELLAAELPGRGALFAAHWRALDGHALNAAVRVWTSGLASWQQLARRGIWVEGCADNLGFDQVKALLQSPALQLPNLADWHAVTHADALPTWHDSGVGYVIATYRNTSTAAEAGAIPPDCKHFYWSSARQFAVLRTKLPADARHACGGGKTLTQLRAAGINNVRVFVSRQEWLQWLN